MRFLRRLTASSRSSLGDAWPVHDRQASVHLPAVGGHGACRPTAPAGSGPRSGAT